MEEIKKNPIVKQLFVPSFVVFAMVLILVFGGNFLYGRISELRNDLDVAKTKEQALANKLAILQEFELQSANISGKVSQAIPEDNPSVSAISQVRSKTSNFGVTATNINVGKSATEDGTLAHADITFEITGPIESTMIFIDALKETAPFGTIEKMTITGLGEAPVSTITYRSYFSSLPESIPASEDPAIAFSEEDKAIIQKLVGLETILGSEVRPQTPTTRSDPFQTF